MPPGFPLTIGTTMTCFHVASAKIPPTPKPVTILGQPVLTPLDVIGVVACPFPPGGPPSPCLTIKWSGLAGKVTVQAQPLLLMPPPNSGPAPAVGIGAGPQGAAIMGINQAKVLAT
jgi:hypothetical protein